VPLDAGAVLLPAGAVPAGAVPEGFGAVLLPIGAVPAGAVLLPIGAVLVPIGALDIGAVLLPIGAVDIGALPVPAAITSMRFGTVTSDMSAFSHFRFEIQNWYAPGEAGAVTTWNCNDDSFARSRI
jgi:hypothetical protein